MAKQSANAGVDEFVSTDDEVSTGHLDTPSEADTTAQSIAEGVLKDLGNEPLIKKSPGRPRKQAAEPVDDDDDSAPPARLMQQEAAAEDEGDEQESTTADTDDGEEHEPSELETQLSALAEEWGVPPQLVAGAESVAEADRIIQRFGGFLYQNGATANGPGQNGQDQNGQFQNGHAQQNAALPAANGAVQKTAADAVEFDPSELDDDEPLKKPFVALLERDKQREREMAQWRQERDQQKAAEFQRAQAQIGQELQTEFTRLSPDLFGDGKRQSPQQYQRLCHVFTVANQMLMGAANTPNAPMPSIKAIAKYATNAAFADDLANKKVLAKREQVSQRQQRRSVGAPARVSRAAGNAPSATVFDGPMDKDPDILGAVKSVLSRTRS